MRTLVNVLWRADLLAVKGVVVLPVIKLLPDAPADLEVMLGRYRHVTGVEQTVDVATKEEAVLRLMVTAFTLAHSLTLSLAVLGVVSPPSRIVEPAIALSIVYVGVDNLLVRQGRDLRAWIALAFGLIHGFGFASVLREMELPPRALGLSLVSFNLGVEIGQLLVVVTVASALAALRARSEVVSRRLAFAGSIGVVGAGSFWFVQRLLFP